MHLEPRPLGAYPWYLRPFFRRQQRRYGAPLTAGLLWARLPRLFLLFSLLWRSFDRRSSPLDPALRSLLMVRISQINHCAFCVDLNTAMLAERGAKQAKIAALPGWRDSDLFDAREKVALEYAEAITRSDRDVDPDLMAAVKAHFDGDTLVELTGLIAFQNMSSKFNSALDVPPQGICTLPGRDSVKS